MGTETHTVTLTAPQQDIASLLDQLRERGVMSRVSQGEPVLINGEVQLVLKGVCLSDVSTIIQISEKITETETEWKLEEDTPYAGAPKA